MVPPCHEPPSQKLTDHRSNYDQMQNSHRVVERQLSPRAARRPERWGLEPPAIWPRRCASDSWHRPDHTPAATWWQTRAALFMHSSLFFLPVLGIQRCMNRTLAVLELGQILFLELHITLHTCLVRDTRTWEDYDRISNPPLSREIVLSSRSSVA
jgi:hypothetical protein